MDGWSRTSSRTQSAGTQDFRGLSPGQGSALVMHILGPVVHHERTVSGSPGDEMVCLEVGAVEGCGPAMMECVRAGGNPEAKMLIL